MVPGVLRLRGSLVVAAGQAGMLRRLVPRPSSVGPWGAGLPPDAEREVEAKTPGTCWGLLSGVPVDRADGRRHPSCQRKSPSWGLPAWPKPKEEVLPRPEPLCQGSRPRGGVGVSLAHRGYLGGEIEETRKCLMVTLTLGLSLRPGVSIHSWGAGGRRGIWSIFRLPMWLSAARLVSVSQPETRSPWVDPPALEVPWQWAVCLPSVPSVKWDDGNNCLVASG